MNTTSLVSLSRDFWALGRAFWLAHPDWFTGWGKTGSDYFDAWNDDRMIRVWSNGRAVAWDLTADEPLEDPPSIWWTDLASLQPLIDWMAG